MYVVPESLGSGGRVLTANSARCCWTSFTPALPPSGLNVNRTFLCNLWYALNRLSRIGCSALDPAPWSVTAPAAAGTASAPAMALSAAIVLVLDLKGRSFLDLPTAC